MSIQSLSRRVAEIESVLDSLSARGVSQLPTGSLQKPDSLDGSNVPFGVLLGQRMGQTSLRPLSGEPTPEMLALVDKYATQNGLDPNLVKAVIRTESDWNVNETSSKGAKGLMQLMPEDCEAYGVSDPLDPEQNIRAGTKQLADKLKKFGGNVDLALAAYNAGSGAVHHYKGVPPFTETQNYVRKVHRNWGR